MKTAFFAANSDRLGRRLIAVTGTADRRSMTAHLGAAYMPDRAHAQPHEFAYGTGFEMAEPLDPALTADPSEPCGVYICNLYTPSIPRHPDRQISERIYVKKAKPWDMLRIARA